MHVQIVYDGPAEEFSWLLPIPLSDLDISVGSDRLFSEAFRLTLPTYTLNVDFEASTTCNSTFDVPCPVSGVPTFDDGAVAEEEREVMVEEGTVGPFDFALLSSEQPGAVFDWLETNGYDQPDGSRDLINFYTVDHQFVAIRLSKESETGDIRPLIISGLLPPEATSSSCVPLQLTRIAAMEDMPIQVYIMGDSRAEPTNFFTVTLDDILVDWVGCQGNPSCYYDDHVSRFRSAIATPEVNRHAFLHEFVGSTSILDGAIEYDISEDDLKDVSDGREFLSLLIAAGVTRTPLIDGIVNKYLPSTAAGVAMFCSSFPTLFDSTMPFLLDQCFSGPVTVDSVMFAAELEKEVFAPAREAQDFVNGFMGKTLTRLYTEQGPDSMIKDPYFHFDPNGVDLSNNHTAVGVPVCSPGMETEPTSLLITIEDGRSIVVDATLGCTFWQRPFGSSPPSMGRNPAKQFGTSAFGDEAAKGILPDDSGSFDQATLMESRSVLDSRAPNQTVIPLEDSTSGLADVKTSFGWAWVLVNLFFP